MSSRPGSKKPFRLITFAILALLIAGGGLYYCAYEGETSSIARRATARWTEIGLPLSKVDEAPAKDAENSGSEVLQQFLRDHLAAHYYQMGANGESEPDLPASPAAESLIKEATNLLAAELPPGDEVKLDGLNTEMIHRQASALDQGYRKILAAEPPTWKYDLHEGFQANLPGFLGVREFVQVAAADAMVQLSSGRLEPAERALSAARRLQPGLRRNPTLISFMVGTAIDALISHQTARLPFAPNELSGLAADAKSVRAELRRLVQVEAWVGLHFGDQDALNSMIAWTSSPYIPPWLRDLVNRPWARRQCAVAALNNADYAVILDDPATRVLPDCGEALYTAIRKARPSAMDLNLARSVIRMESTLLAREQSALIREARAHLNAGQPMETRPSVILPEARWEFTSDPKQGTLSTRLTGAPAWVYKDDVLSKHFWPLPIDGSAAWQFHLAAKPAHR